MTQQPADNLIACFHTKLRKLFIVVFSKKQKIGTVCPLGGNKKCYRQQLAINKLIQNFLPNNENEKRNQYQIISPYVRTHFRPIESEILPLVIAPTMAPIATIEPKREYCKILVMYGLRQNSEFLKEFGLSAVQVWPADVRFK